MGESILRGIILVTTIITLFLLLLQLINLWLMSWGHRFRAQAATHHRWNYQPYIRALFQKGVVFQLNSCTDEAIQWELNAYQSGLNKVRLHWYSESTCFPEGLVVVYPRPGRIMKVVPRSLIPTMLNRVFGPVAVPLSDHVVETPLGDEMLDELFFVFAAHRALVPRLLTPAIRNLLVHWPAPKGYTQRPIVSLFHRGLRLETVEPVSVNDWLTTERFVGLGETISRYINPFLSHSADE
ncbi:MAG: hypothetical protein KA314_01320 [Chloroflexi bacterium]|nr:hypothetical protein [Chloroflexota bacterium]MBP8054447.1 hypothetical protein [Chloroflexota bacterium]